MHIFHDKTCRDHNAVLTVPRWPSPGAVSVTHVSLFRLEVRTNFEDLLVKEDIVEVSQTVGEITVFLN